jgi:hypothetical protein
MHFSALRREAQLTAKDKTISFLNFLSSARKKDFREKYTFSNCLFRRFEDPAAMLSAFDQWEVLCSPGKDLQAPRNPVLKK